VRVVIATYEPNLWLAELAEAYWQRAWPECAWPVEVVSGSGAWADVMLDWLQGQTEPFLLLLEDYITTHVDKRLMGNAQTALSRPDVGTVRLVPMPRQPVGGKYVGWHNVKLPYAMSLQAALWKPDALRIMLRPGECAWATEVRGSQRAKQRAHFRFMGTKDWAIRYQNYLARGVVNPDAERWMREHGI